MDGRAASGIRVPTALPVSLGVNLGGPVPASLNKRTDLGLIGILTP